MKKRIYCISGLGADEHIFKHIRVDGYELVHVPWLRPARQEDIATYATRMASAIVDENPIIVGVSFGGMVAIEIARLRPTRQVFIISSIKSGDELPVWMKLAGWLSLHKFIPVRSFKITEKIDNNRLGVSTPEEKMMVRNYRRNADQVYVNWAINEVLNWKNTWQPSRLVHIHGDRDRMFPIKRIRASHIVREGTHLMIYNRAGEISTIIQNELQGD
jgi:pimeloyl-ACP methyl ester carboxylesterase